MAGEMGIVCDMCQLLGGAVPATVSWYSHNFWDAIPTYGYNQAFTIYYAPTALSNVHFFCPAGCKLSKFVGVVHLKNLKLHKFNLIAILKDVYLVGLPFFSRYSGKGTSGALHRIQPIHKKHRSRDR